MSITRLTRMVSVVRALLLVIAAAVPNIKAPAATRTFRAEINSNVELTNVYSVYVARWGEDWFESATKLADKVEANTPYEFMFDMEVENPDSVYAPLSLTYSIAGLYQGGVSLALETSYADSLTQAGLEWSEAFAAQYGYQSEDYIADRLKNDDPNNVFRAWWSLLHARGQLPAIGDSGQLVQFSGAAYGGSVSVTVVPEPSATGLGFLGAAVLLLLRSWKHLSRVKNK